jgi:hypothetical protein
MKTSATNESEHRRGLVLGLTLAEILILLLFMLLLALGVRIKTLNGRLHEVQATNVSLEATIGEFAPLLAEFKFRGAIESNTIQEIVLRLKKVRELEQSVRDLQARNAELGQKMVLFNALGTNALEKIKGFEDALAGVARIDPSDPPGMLKQAVGVIQHAGNSDSDMVENVSVLERAVTRAAAIDPQNPPAVLEKSLKVLEQLGPDTKPEELKGLIELASAGSQSAKTIADLREESDRFRRARDNLMLGGRGLMFPSCWTTEKGETEYIFDVSIRDTGVLVKDASPAYRRSQESWKYLDDFSRDTEIPETKFRSATARLDKWSREKECRFVVTMRDETGRTSKVRYKNLRTLVEQHFYVKPVELPRTSGLPPRATPSRESSLGRNVQPSLGATRPMGGPFVPVPGQ